MPSCFDLRCLAFHQVSEDVIYFFFAMGIACLFVFQTYCGQVESGSVRFILRDTTVTFYFSIQRCKITFI